MKRNILVTISFLIIICLISCNKDKLEWEKIKHTDNIEVCERFLSSFPKSAYYDSALMNMEKLIYYSSINSKTKTGILEYENYIKTHPRIKELISTEGKIRYLKLRSDTIEILGRLVDSASEPIIGAHIDALPLDENNDIKIIIKDGKYNNPTTTSNSNGEFKLKGHRSFLLETNTFTLNISSGVKWSSFILTEDGSRITFKIDTNTRIVDIGTIVGEN